MEKFGREKLRKRELHSNIIQTNHYYSNKNYPTI